MIFLKTFNFASDADETWFIYKDPKSWMPKMRCFSSFYPFKILPEKGLESLAFNAPITILYGDNGSGKTTVLNIIAEKTGVARTALYNKTAFFKPYLELCSYSEEEEIPASSMMIASDDVFNYMLNMRALNQDVDIKRENLFEEYNKVKFGKTSDLLHINFEDQASVEAFDRNMAILKNSKSKFVRKNLINNTREHSNGESALLYFQEKITDNALYLLDEPENSLSAQKLIELAKYIEASAIGCGCQFIIATHSPFLLTMERSQIYDLDECPVIPKNWTELKNIQLYREFFKEHEKEFTSIAK